MVDKFQISRDLVDKMIAHAKSEAPREVCGMIGGHGFEAGAVYPTKNPDAGNMTYSIAPSEAFAVIRRMRDEGLDFIACYHSHPATEAYPSPTDRAKAGESDLIYAILSLRNREAPELRAFTIGQGEVGELAVIID